MVKLIMLTPRVWKQGEVFKAKVIRVSMQREGVWELVLEEIKPSKRPLPKKMGIPG